MDREVAIGRIRKRKAENQDNERLSKRLSLLNLEKNGSKLYVPVESPNTPPPASPEPKIKSKERDDIMRLDDTAHKVYIYDLDAELSDSESSDDGKLVFLPDIEKHLLQTRIPPAVLVNSEGELAGCSQLVLYNIPTSLSVPKEQDSVRKAIIETRARAREMQAEREKELQTSKPTSTGIALGIKGADGIFVAKETMDMINGTSWTTTPSMNGTAQVNSDAMDLD